MQRDVNMAIIRLSENRFMSMHLPITEHSFDEFESDLTAGGYLNDIGYSQIAFVTYNAEAESSDLVRSVTVDGPVLLKDMPPKDFHPILAHILEELLVSSSISSIQ